MPFNAQVCKRRRPDSVYEQYQRGKNNISELNHFLSNARDENSKFKYMCISKMIHFKEPPTSIFQIKHPSLQQRLKHLLQSL